MSAAVAAGYCGEDSVEAFMKRVGNEYPHPGVNHGRRKLWLRDDLDQAMKMNYRVREALRQRLEREAKRNDTSLNSEMTRRLEGSLNAEERLADLVGREKNVQLFQVLGGAIGIIEAETGRPWEHDAKTWMCVSNSIQVILNGFRFFEESEPSPGTRAAPSRRLLKSLEAAMRRHFKAGRIWDEPRGKPSLKRFRIVLK
jgi:Arc-like DNA binding domain